MAYRDELEAAQARADALQRRVTELEREKAELEARQTAPPTTTIIVREPARPPVAARKHRQEIDGISRKAVGLGLILLFGGIIASELFAALIGVAIGVFVVVLWGISLVMRDRGDAPEERPRRSPSHLPRRIEVTVETGGRELLVVGEVRVRADDPTAARYIGVPDTEIDSTARGVLASELQDALHTGVSALERRLRAAVSARFDALGLELVSLGVGGVGRGVP